MAEIYAAKEIGKKNYKNLQLESRWSQREHIYHQDMPKLSIDVEGLQTPIEADILDISVDGLSLCHPTFNSNMVGKRISVRLKHSKSYQLNGVINNFRKINQSGELRNRVGIKFQSNIENINFRFRRCTSPVGHEAMAYTKSPFRFNHICHYKVFDFSSNGLTLEGNNTSDIMLPGVILKLKVFIPSYGVFNLDAEVTNIRRTKKPHVFRVGCTYKTTSTAYLTAAASYLLSDTNSTCSVEDLISNGFLVSFIGEFAKFGYVSSQKEWLELLSLRRRSAQHEGRWLGCTDDLMMIDDYDKFARHLQCRLGNQIVAGARISFNNGDLNRCEHTKYIKIPQFIQDGGFIEASRVCTDPNYRKTNLFLLVLQNCARVGIQSKCRYILLNCEDSLVKIYKRFGAKELNMSFTNEYMNGKRLNVMYYDLHAILNGKSINWFNWNIGFRDLFFHMKSKGITSPSFIDYLRVFTILSITTPILNYKKKKYLKKLSIKRLNLLKNMKNRIEVKK